MAQAEPVYQAAREQSLRILQAVRLGQALDVATVKEVVKGCVESILRNPAAMLWLARIKHKDEYTSEHSLRVAILSIALGRELGLLPLQLEQIGVCGMLHDVGKIKVPEEILEQARGADAGGAVDHAKPRDRRAQAAAEQPTGHCSHCGCRLFPPRASRRARLSARAGRRQDSLLRQDSRGGRQLRCDQQRPGLQQGQVLSASPCASSSMPATAISMPMSSRPSST